jgi:lysozyme
MKNFTVSPNGIKFIAGHEGEILRVYADPVGLLTLGVGHLLTAAEKKAMPLGTKITQKQSREYLAKDLQRFERAINAAVAVPITQNQFDALVSFAFNVGESAFKRSSVLRNLNNRKFAAAADSLLAWNKAGGRVLKGLTRRRKEERELFLTPDKISNSAADQPSTSSTKPADDPAISEQGAAVLDAHSDPLPSTTQIADNIVNAAPPPGPPPEDKDVTAPTKDGATSASTKMVIAGFTIPPILAGILKSVSDGVSQGYVNAGEVGSFLLSFLRDNIKWVLVLVGLVIVLHIVKKVVKQITFWIEMLTKAVPHWNSITVVPAKQESKPPWWKFW